jgi:hypothetical protein
MKKAISFSLILILCLSLDASAFHWRLFHRHGAQPLPAGQIFHAPGVLVSPPGSNSGTAPSISVPAEVSQSIKAADKNLREASTTLDPLIKKYKLDTSTSGTAGTSPGALGEAIQNLTQPQRQELLDILKKKKI